MTTTRLFTGARGPNSTIGEAARLKKWEIMKGGSIAMSSNERYKHIMTKKIAEFQQKSRTNTRQGFELSTRARQALEDIAKRKAMKEEKAMRQMVVIKPRNYGELGNLDAKGRVYDQAGNIVLKINRKNGKINTMGGMTIGKYRAKRMGTHGLIKDGIVKFSPYHIKLRQMMAQQQLQQMYNANGYNPSTAASVYGYGDEDASAVNIYGKNSTGYEAESVSPVYGRSPHQRGGSVGVNGWGVMSNNVLGMFAEDTWGNFRDNVWGGTHNNVWGGLGDDGSLWSGNGSGAWGKSRGAGIWGSSGTGGVWGSSGGRRIFGTGNGKNYLAKAFWTALGMTRLGSKLAARSTAKSKFMANLRSVRTTGRTVN